MSKVDHSMIHRCFFWGGELQLHWVSLCSANGTGCDDATITQPLGTEWHRSGDAPRPLTSERGCLATYPQFNFRQSSMVNF